MPTYQYSCTECGEPLEAVQSFSDDPLTVCPACGGRLRKVFSPVGIVFKGSGFYRTDSRSTANGSGTKSKDAAAATKTDGGDKAGASTKDGGSSTSSSNGSSDSSKTATKAPAGSSTSTSD